VNDTQVNPGFAYLLILALAGAMWLQWRRIEALTREVQTLEQRIRALAAAREPLTLTNPLPNDEPLLLDTPLPDVANDEAAFAPAQTINAVTWAVGATLLGLFAWHFIAFAADDMAFAIGLLGAAAVVGVAPLAHAPLRQPLALAPSMTLALCGVFLIWTWPAIAGAPLERIAWSGSVGLLLIALSAVAVRKRWIRASVFAVIAAGLVLGVAGYFRARERITALPELAPYGWAALLGVALIAAIYAARANRHDRVTMAAAGSLGAAALFTLAAFSRDTMASFLALTPLIGGMTLLAGLSAIASRSSADAATDAALAWPAGAASGLALIAVHAMTPAAFWPLALAAATLGLAFIYARLDWRILRRATLVAAALSVMHAWLGAGPDAELPGIAPNIALVVLPLLSAALFYFSWRIFRFESNDTSRGAELISASASAAGLAALFQALAALGFDRFVTTALQALALFAAGHLIAPRNGTPAGIVARWQGPVLIAVGIVFSLLLCGIELNPWWGRSPARIDGPPLLDPQLVAFLLSAIASLVSAGRWAERAPNFSRWCLFAAIALLVLWLTLEVRRAFHPAMPYGAVGIWEALLYLVIIAIVAAGLRTRWDRERFATLVRGSYERMFGAPGPAPAPQPLLPTTPGARRRRTRR
jgi:hypothetical protein